MMTRTIAGIQWQIRSLMIRGVASVGFSADMSHAQLAAHREFLALATSKGWDVKVYDSRDDADMDPGTAQVCMFAAADALDGIPEVAA